MEESIEKLIYEETDLRLKEMEAKDYVFPRRADKMDVLGIIVAIGISVMLIILCMIGVIV